MSNTDRLQGLRRWEEYLTARIKPWGIVRKTGKESGTHDAVWRVGFPDDTRARIRVTDGTLQLDQSAFEEVTYHLEAVDCLGKLRDVSPGGIRIHPDGRMEELAPEGIEEEWA